MWLVGDPSFVYFIFFVLVLLVHNQKWSSSRPNYGKYNECEQSPSSAQSCEAVHNVYKFMKNRSYEKTSSLNEMNQPWKMVLLFTGVLLRAVSRISAEKTTETSESTGVSTARKRQ